MNFKPPPFDNKAKGENASNSTTLTAVAFQDHLVRSLNLGAGMQTFGPKRVGLGPAARAQQKKKKEPRSVLDTGRNRQRKPKNEETAEKEYVLDPKAAPLTLAQKMGLVEAPEQLLSENDWRSVKERSNKRDDSKQPCVICKEDFGVQEQVLLSCTHVFHRACLQAFERFSGKKTCPMCRREQYQTRVIHEGAKEWKLKCATRIQAAWRGYVVKSWYKKLRETVPPNDPKLRQKYYEEKLSSITDRIVRSCDFNVNTFLTEIDDDLAVSRNIFRQFDQMFNKLSDEQWDDVQLRAVVRGKEECPICLTSLSDHTHTHNSKEEEVVSVKTDIPPSLAAAGFPSNKRKTKPQKTSNVTKPTPKTKSVNMKMRQTVLLSCSHVFHVTCLETFEELSMSEGRNVCPVCRAVYQKKILGA